jgi:hypothetical protein
MSIRLRYYGVDGQPIWCSVDAQHTGRSAAARRFPWVEALFKFRYVQPFIHEIKATVREDGIDEQFVILCQNHRHLPFNAAVPGEWRGEIVAMRIGKNKAMFINMPTGDARKIDLAISQ